MRFLLSILLCLIAAYALSLYLTVGANPEVTFWREVMVKRDKDIEVARRAMPDSAAVFFTGGSSTAFSIDPLIVEEGCGLPSFNLGLPISAGAPYILHQAFKRTRPGDTLVICLEADILSFGGETKSSTLSLALGLLEKEPSGAAGGSTFNSSLGPRQALNLSRPGPRFLLTLAGRQVMNKGYRYKLSDIRYHGRIETGQDNPSMVALAETSSRRLHPEGRKLLETLSKAAKSRGVSLYYSMPWRWVLPEFEEAWRTANLELLREINAIVPILNDGSGGVASRREYFSDSHQHLTAEGSAERTKLLVPVLNRSLTKSEPRLPEIR